MKKELSFIFSLLFITFCAYSQNNVTKFLGIPVDGTKAAMKQQLIKKGFTPKNVGGHDFLEGEFNGADVRVFIVTNNNKVYRIMLSDVVTRDEANIKIRFNNLVKQFNNNKRYTPLNDYSIADDVDISYEMAVNNKTFEASYLQDVDFSKIDTASVNKQCLEILKYKFPQEYINSHEDEMIDELKKIAENLLLEIASKKNVWFRIFESYGEYFISMYYDNDYNKANGEDL